ncbi:MAG: hypothetical protein LAT67_02125 [Balneolales bacterium]|nr:hypothetical protein [Balneolales bacterium]
MPKGWVWMGKTNEIIFVEKNGALKQYYFRELKLKPDRNYFRDDESITIFYTNRGFDSV